MIYIAFSVTCMCCIMVSQRLNGTRPPRRHLHERRRQLSFDNSYKIEPVHEISNNVVCASSKASDQPAHACSLIRAFASRLSIL